jgi:hypothetical protein
MTAFLITYPGFALVALLVPSLAVRWFVAPADRFRTEWMLAASLLIEPAGICAQLTANALSGLCPGKLDLYIYEIDRHMGAPSFVIGQAAAAHAWLRILLSVSYGLLPMAVLGVAAAYLYLRSLRETIQAGWAFVANLFLALPLYIIFPVCGPGFAFRCFPARPAADLVPHLVAIAAAPNGIPSVHTSTALLCAWLLRRWAWGRVAGLSYLALIVLSTLGGGQHYLVDLLCAVPYTAAILWLTTPRRKEVAA